MSITIPDIVDYPKFYDVADNFQIFNKVFCYIINKYDFSGYAMYIGFRNKYSFCRLSDFKSNEIDHNDLNDKSLEILSLQDSFKDLMRHARISDALFYFSVGDNIKLVDVMLSINKFVGPGMLKDLFGNIIDTQDVVGTEIIDDSNVHKYKSKILKPSKFRYLVEGSSIRPSYGIIN